MNTNLTSLLAKAEKILMQDEEQNAYSILRIHQNAISECVIFENAVRLLDGECGKYLYAFDTFEQFETLYSQVLDREGPLVSLVANTRFAEKISAYNKNIALNCFVQVRSAKYTKPIPNASTKNSKIIEFGDVTEDMIDYMLSVYEHPEMCREFILKRIAVAPHAAAFCEGKPVGFFITHSDAELGPAYINPEFRGMGISEALYARIMNQFSEKVKDIKDYPLGFIHPDNSASLGWLKRMGCVQSKEQILWFWRE